MSIMGYARPDGSFGIRNHVAAIASVGCANGVIEAVARRVSGVKPLTHSEGCGRGPQDLIATTRALTGLGKNPNVGGAVVVGLGCEFLKAPMIGGEIQGSNKPTEILVIQESGGSQQAIEKAVAAARKITEGLDSAPDRQISWSDLTIGVDFAGALEPASEVAHAALGRFIDAVVDRGARVVIPGLCELYASDDELGGVVASPGLVERARALAGERDKARLKVFGSEAPAARSRNNASLGIGSLGLESKVRGLLEPGSPPSEPGLFVMDTPGADAFAMTALAAAGVHLIVQTTERGNPAGFPLVPVVKVATLSETYALMPDDIDFDAGRASDQGATQVGDELARLVEGVLSGALTRAEDNDYDVFALETFGPAF